MTLNTQELHGKIAELERQLAQKEKECEAASTLVEVMSEERDSMYTALRKRVDELESREIDYITQAEHLRKRVEELEGAIHMHRYKIRDMGASHYEQQLIDKKLWSHHPEQQDTGGEA